MPPFPFWFLECLGCSFPYCKLIPLCILLEGRVVVLEFWIQVFASPHFISSYLGQVTPACFGSGGLALGEK